MWWNKKAKHPVENMHPRSLRYLSGKLHGLVKNKLWLQVILGLFLGILTGLAIRGSGWFSQDVSYAIGEWLAFPGLIFLRVVQMIVIPLILASIIKGIAATESIKQLKKTGIGIAVYFVLTSTIAVVIGIALSSFIQPGQYIDVEELQLSATELPDTTVTFSGKDLPTMISTILPTNLISSLLNANMLQIVIFSIIFGIALINVEVSQSKPILELMGSLQNVCMTIVKWAMLLAPFAVFGLMAKLTTQFGADMLYGIGVYALTVFAGLGILFLFYCCILFFVSKKNPIEFIKQIKDVQLLAFSTSSSAAVMPLSMKTAEEKLHVHPSLSQFIIPIGATINMDGTALYQTIATLFLAQVYGIELSFTALLLLIATIVGASIGAPGTPGVGITILATILTGLGIPITGIALILGIDRILDMSRTTINVTGDLTAATVMDRFVEKKESHTATMKKERKREQQRKKLKHDTIITKR